MSELPLIFWGLDIETDNSTGLGLDPTKAQIISIAMVCNDGQVWYRSARTVEDERSMLIESSSFLRETVTDGLIVTWNGGAFDWPFLTTRTAVQQTATPWALVLDEDRQPKYEALNGYNGVYKVFTATGASHLDMAYVMDREWAEKHDCSWSLKPVADALGFRDTALEHMRGESAYEVPAHMLAAYNIHDSLITLRLALWASAFEHVPELSLGLREKLDR